METYKSIKWEDSLSVGYVVIDGHHKKLVSLTEELYSILSMPDPLYRLKIGKILKRLSDYTVYHFQEEEKIMERYSYPALAEHAKIHASFVKKLNEALPLIATGNREVGMEMYGFLTKWLVEHIAGADHEWSKYIHETYPDEKF